jgi:hypothetical protein
MDRQELERLLRDEGIDERAYSLDGGMPPERLCLALEGPRWVVYYSERGIRTGLHRFTSESAACQYLLTRLRDDPTTRSRSAYKADE